MSLVTGSTFSGIDIHTILLLTSYTIVTPGKYTFQVYLDAVAGGGDYTLNMRRKFGGVGVDYVLVPKTTYTAAAGAQAIGFPSIGVECNTNDLVSFYALGLAGDTAVTGTAYIYMDDWVRSTTPANTFDVSATGEGGLDFNNIKDASGAKTLTNITVPVATSVGTVTGNVNGSVASVTNPVVASAVAGGYVTATGTVNANVVSQANIDFGALQKSSLNAATPASVTTVTGNVNGSVASVAGNIGGTVQAVVDGYVTVTGTVSANIIQWRGTQPNVLQTNRVDAYVGENNDKTGYALSATGVDAIIDEIIEGTLTLRQSLRIIYAVLFGKSTGGGTASVTFRDIGDTKARVTATVDANGNRTGITTDGT
jgi:hypothetical protein